MHGSSDLRPASLYETQGLIRLQHPVSHAVFYSMRNLLLLFFLLIVIGATSSAAGQSAVSRENLYGVTYRPMEARYLVGRYPHFDLIYQAGTEATAFEIATRLERQLAATQRFVGAPTDRLQMPVIVNGYNDRSNGFVSPFPFRQEIEAPSIKSNALTVPFPSWPAAVAPHELVHAAHANVDAGIGVGGAIRWLGPDWSRVINLVAPSGLIEGAAVYRESQLYPRAGRLNAPLATMTFRAAMLSEDPWSMTQMLEAPTYTRPFDRHYVGGGQAFAFLTERGASSEPAFFHRAIRLHHRAPFLGFGIGLWHGTGAPPARLGRTLQDSLVARVRAIHTARQPFTDVDLIDGADGLHYRRPHWLTDSTLVVHAQGYATRTGFYAIDEPTGRRQFISAQRVTEAYGISIAPDSTDLYFSRYVADPLVTRQAFAEVHRLDLSDGTTTQLTRVGRAHAPVTTPDGQLWTLQNEGSINQWSLVGPDGTVEPLTEVADARFRQIAPSPRGGQVAVLLNVQGEQRIYRAVLPGDAQRPRLHPWLGMAEGAIYDVNWSPDGRHLLFSADWRGGVNIFALEVETGTVRQLTNVAFGALEPTVSPKGTRLAFVTYRHERFDLVQIPFQPSARPVIPEAALVRPGEDGWTTPDALEASLEIQPPSTITTYRALPELRPRLVYPVLDVSINGTDSPLGAKVGLGAAGADPLGRWAYSGEAFVRANRLWGSLQVQTGRHWLRPRVRLYSEPTPAGAVGVEERGAAVRIGAPYTVTRNVQLTQLQGQLDSAIEQARFIDRDGNPRSAFSSRWTLRPSAAWGIGLERNLRDLMLRRGLILQAVSEVDLWSNRPRRLGALGAVRLHVPLWPQWNTGVNVYARVLSQNRTAVISPSALLPRSYNDRGLGAGTFATWGAEVLQPLTYVDDGLTLVPLYVQALYAYGFAESIRALEGEAGSLSAVGGGLGIRLRFFYALNVDLRLGAAYRPTDRDVRLITR